MTDADFDFLYDDIDDFAVPAAALEADIYDTSAAGGNTSGDGNDSGNGNGEEEQEDDFYNPDEMEEAPEDDGIIVCSEQHTLKTTHIKQHIHVFMFFFHLQTQLNRTRENEFH